MVSKDLLEEVRLQDITNNHRNMASMERTYNWKVHPREFSLGDRVLKRNPNPVGVGKLQSKF